MDFGRITMIRFVNTVITYLLKEYARGVWLPTNRPGCWKGKSAVFQMPAAVGVVRVVDVCPAPADKQG